MANVTGTFSADGVSAAYSAQGNIDVSVKIKGSATGSVHIQLSYDGGTTWYAMEGGNLSKNSSDRIIVSGSATTQYRLSARGVSGSILYFIGAE